MTILRDLVSRVTFKADTTELESLNNKMDLVKRSIVGIATTALAGWAIRTGGELDFLQQQLGIGGDRIEGLKKRVEELAAVDAFGTASIFSRSELTQAATNLDRLGISGEEAMLRIDQASTLLVRARTTSIAEVTQRLGAALQKGGIADLFLEFGLIDIKAADRLKIIENQLASASGVLLAEITREYRKSASGIIEANKEVLEGELAKLVKSTMGLNLQLGASMKNLWDETARTITKVMEGPLKGLVKLMIVLEGSVRKVRVAMDEAGSASKAFFDVLKLTWPKHNEDIERAAAVWKGLTDFIGLAFNTTVGATLSIGGIAMFLLTKNPLWLLGGIGMGAVAGKTKELSEEVEKFFRDAGEGDLVQGFLNREVDALNKVLGALGFMQPGAVFGPLKEDQEAPIDLGSPATPGSGEQQRELEEIFPDRPGGMEPSSETPPSATLPTGGQNVSVSVGNVNITVQGAGSSASEIARLVKKEFEEQVLRVAMEFGPLHEGVS